MFTPWHSQKGSGFNPEPFSDCAQPFDVVRRGKRACSLLMQDAD